MKQLFDFWKSLSTIINIKGLLAIVLTITFCVLCVNQMLDQAFMTIYTVVIAFYFGSKTTSGDADE